MTEVVKPNPTIDDFKPHRAFYHAVTTHRWFIAQKREFDFWQKKGSFDSRRVYSRRYYLPHIKPLMDSNLTDTSILEIGSGPVCVAQYLEQGSKTYLDTLLDNYRRFFPGLMPASSIYISEMAESIALPAQNFNLVICLNAISDMHNPELVLNQVEQTLKQGGFFVVSLSLWPAWLARLHFMLSRFTPVSPRFNRLYSYTDQGFTNTLLRHFRIVSKVKLKPTLSWLSPRQEYLFVCKHRNDQ